MAKRQITRAQFSAQCSYIAKNAASWAAGELDLSEELNKPARPDAVARFTDEMRGRLDRIDEMAGRQFGLEVKASLAEIEKIKQTMDAEQAPIPVTSISFPRRFLHELIENAFSWALQDCNYLNPKYMDSLIDATIAGMKPEQAATWRADSPIIPEATYGGLFCTQLRNGYQSNRPNAKKADGDG